MGRKYKYKQEDRDAIINYFYSHNDNRDAVIAEVLGYPEPLVSKTIANHLEQVQKSINKK